LKGQLTIEYMLSFVAFIALMIFIYFQYSSNIPNFMFEVDKENSRSKAYQLSELLLNDPGDPVNWDETTVDRPGLSSEIENKRNLISLVKIENFQNLCSNYQDLQGKLAFNQPFSIYFNRIEGDGSRSRLLSCNPPETLKEITKINATVRRITTFYDYTDDTIKFGELIIEV